MTPGGAVLAGTTVLVAVMDGGLSTLVGSAVAGGAGYVAWRRRPNNIVEGVVKTQLNAWEERIRNETDPDRKRKLQKEAEAAEKSYRQRLGYDKELVKMSAAAVGVGIAMSPIVGVGLLAFATRKRWIPPLVAVADVIREGQTRFHDEGALNEAYVGMCVS